MQKLHENAINPQQLSTKLNYLLEENKLLKERVRDLEEIIKLNRNACERSQKLSTIASIPGVPDEKARLFKEINENLARENAQLCEKVEKLLKDREFFNDKAFLSQQVANEFQRQEKETKSDYKGEISNLLRKLEEKEKKLKEIQAGGLFRVKNIVVPEEKSLLFHNEIASLKASLVKISKKCASLATHRQELVKLNQQFFNEILRLKEILSVKCLDFKGKPQENANFFTTTGQSLDLLEYHKKFYHIDRENSSILEELSPLNSPLPLKIEPLQGNSGKKQQEIPRLDITKALLIQEMNINEKRKNNGSELPQRETVLNATNTAEKIKKLEAELKRTKKLLQQEMLENQLLKSQISRVDEELRSLRAKNKLLVESQKNFEQKFRKLSVFLHSSRGKSGRFPGNFSHNRNKSENNANTLLNFNNFLCVNAANLASCNKISTDSLVISNNNEQLSTDELFYRDLEPLDTRNCRKIVNLSLIDSEDCRNEDFSERKQYIRFLQSMGDSLNLLLRNPGKNPKRKSGNMRSWRSVSLSNVGKCERNYEKKNDFIENFNNNNNIICNNCNNIGNNNGFFNENNNNKYFSLRNDLKDVVKKCFAHKSQTNLNMPNPRMERNLISPISKPNDQENFSSTLRQLHNHSLSLPFSLSIGNLGNEEVFL